MTHHHWPLAFLALWLLVGAIVGGALSAWAFWTHRGTDAAWRRRDYVVTLVGALVAWPVVVGIGYAARRGHASPPDGWSGGAR